MNYFITAIHTDSGKTLVSAILTYALQADYWKPIQCGYPRDIDTVRSLVNNTHCLFFDETYLLKEPMSPHAAAKIDNVKIDLDTIVKPDNEGHTLIIEGAGGVLVPLNEKDFVIDIVPRVEAEIILVSNNYLGSINHTLLTVNEIKRRGLTVKGIIFNGPENKETEDFIVQYSGYKSLLKIRPEKDINEEVIAKYAVQLFQNW